MLPLIPTLGTLHFPSVGRSICQQCQTQIQAHHRSLEQGIWVKGHNGGRCGGCMRERLPFRQPHRAKRNHQTKTILSTGARICHKACKGAQDISRHHRNRVLVYDCLCQRQFLLYRSRQDLLRRRLRTSPQWFQICVYFNRYPLLVHDLLYFGHAQSVAANIYKTHRKKLNNAGRESVSATNCAIV